MTRMRISGSRSVAALVVACALVAAGSVSLAAQVSGRAYGVFVDTPVAYQARVVSATLPGTPSPTGDMRTAESAGLSVPGALSSSFLNSVATGAVEGSGGSAQSVASVADVNILNGLIRAAEVVAVAASSHAGGVASSSANGSTFESLVVGGVPVTSGDQSVAPNTRISLPGVGYVILNEQVLSGNGATSSGITVNMIRVVLTGLLGMKVGEIVVASARSAVD